MEHESVLHIVKQLTLFLKTFWQKQKTNKEIGND